MNFIVNGTILFVLILNLVCGSVNVVISNMDPELSQKVKVCCINTVARRERESGM